MNAIYQAVANGAYVTSGRSTFSDAHEYARRAMGWEAHLREPRRTWTVVESRWDAESRTWVRFASTDVPQAMAIAPF